MFTIRTLVAFGLIAGLGTCAVAAEKGIPKSAAHSKPSTTRKPVDKSRTATGDLKPANDKVRSKGLSGGDSPPAVFHIHVNPVTNRPKDGAEATTGLGASQGAGAHAGPRSVPMTGKVRRMSTFLVQLCGE